MVIVTGKFSSTCSHHLLPFIGQFWFGYIPDKKIEELKLIRAAKEQAQKRLDELKGLPEETAEEEI